MESHKMQPHGSYPPNKNNPPASFFTLPTELRLRVYRYVFDGAEQHLAHFTSPPLIKAFPLLRTEALPEYLKAVKLIAIVRSNVPTYMASIVPTYMLRFIESRVSDFAREIYANDYDLPAGQLSLHRHVKVSLDTNNGSIEPVFHRIELRTYHIADVEGSQKMNYPVSTEWRKKSVSGTPYPGRSYHYDASISLQWSKKGGLQISEQQPYTRRGYSLISQWTMRVAEPVEELASEMVQIEGFRGFTVKNLEELAGECRGA